jgi:hypothetical protein
LIKSLQLNIFGNYVDILPGLKHLGFLASSKG